MAFRKWIISGLFVMALLSACSAASTQTSQETGSYTNISVQELDTMMQNKDFLLVNVHVPDEGNIPQTDLSIPYDQIEQQVSQLPADKDAKIVLYCRSGNMSTTAAEDLVRLGYTHIYELDGGFTEWKQAGLPFEQ
jgi:rhodanese-related sulfurtransferase